MSKWNSAEGAQAMIDKIASMGATEVADTLERDLIAKPTGLHLWPEAARRVIELLRAQSGCAAIEQSHRPNENEAVAQPQAGTGEKT